jgi:protein-tyrosine phosphatase
VVLGYSLLHWADLIFVMERNHKEKILKQFPEVTREKKIVVLDIPNGFEYMDPELVSMLDRVVLPYLH